MLLSVVVVDDCRVGSLKSTSRLPVVSVRAYRACDSSACLPRAIMDGIFGCWIALVQYVRALWPVIRCALWFVSKCVSTDGSNDPVCSWATSRKSSREKVCS